jgi:hypothetical protein
MLLDATTLEKEAASGQRRGVTRTWGTPDDGAGIAVSSTSASVVPQAAVCHSTEFKTTDGNGTISPDAPTVMDGQR